MTGDVVDALADALTAELGERLTPADLDTRLRRDEPLGARTTYRVGGAAALWLEAEEEADLVALHRALVAVGGPVPVLVVGKGSNMLVADAGFPGLALGLGAGFDWVHIDDSQVRAGAAAGYPVVARRSAAAGLRGLEWAVGVPGSVGGALRMNAGGHGSETAQVLQAYRRFDLAGGSAHDEPAVALGAGYRRSALRVSDVVVSATFALRAGSVDEAQAAVSEVVRWRRANQPGGSNAGSVFTNPTEAPAGRLVEEAGCKGLRVGTAEVSPKHANFIQADDGGSADDVRRLVDHVRAAVAERTGVQLVAELRMAGFPDVPLPMVEALSPSSGGRG